MLTGLFGQGIGQAIGAYNHLGGLGSSAQQAQNAYPSYQGYQQQAIAQQMAHTSQAGQMYKPMEWMIAGKSVSFKEFVDIMFPEDTPEKTAFILKYAKD